MKSKIKSSLIKGLTILCALTLSVFATSMFGGKVFADETAKFGAVQGASIRCPIEYDEIVNGEEVRYKGIKFVTEVNAAWFEANPADEYKFGALVFPTKNGAIDTEISVKANKNTLDAVKFIVDADSVRASGSYATSIVFDYETIKNTLIEEGKVSVYDDDLEEKVNEALTNLYAMDLTVAPFAEVDGREIYADTYSTSMIKVAARLYDYEDYRELAKEYLGNGNVIVKECGVSPKNNTVSGFETDSQHVARVVAGNVDITYSINENGNIVLDSAFVAERLGTQEKIYIFDENNNLTILNVTFKEKLSSQTDWTEIKDTWIKVEWYDPSHVHNYVLKEEVKATCLESGYAIYKCSCNDSYVTYYEALGHDYKAVVTAPTCETQGFTTYTCSRCNDSYVDNYVDALGHTEVIDEAVSATCMVTGMTEGSHCSVCGKVLKAQEIVFALGHDYKAVVTAPMCETQGFTTYTCSRCNDSYVDNYVDALGHTEVVDEAVNPTCTATGLTEGSHCSVCGEVLKAQEVIDALGHDYKAVVTAPTCLEQGFTTYTCANCNDSYVDNYVEALGHSYGSPELVNEKFEFTCQACDYVFVNYPYDIVTQNPTCLEKGYSDYYYDFDNDGIVEEDEFVRANYVDALGHDYKAVVTAPTCVAQGFTTYTCANCGDSYVDNYVDALGHTEVVDEAVNPTCTATGLTAGLHCSVCGEVLKAQEVIDALGHTEVVDEAVEATCTQTGLTEGSHCSVCGEVLKAQEVVDALGHDYKAVVTDPTCEEQGYTTYTCSNCNDSYVADYVDALGHDLTDWEEVIAPTCEYAGEKERHCNVCGYSETQEIEMLEHNYVSGVCEYCGAQLNVAWVPIKDSWIQIEWYDPTHVHEYVVLEEVKPTCLTGGYAIYKCYCNGRYRQNFDALGHNYKAVVTAPTCLAQGYTTYTCADCGDSYVGDYVAALGHNYNQMVATEGYFASGATCEERARYYYSCVCGLKGSETFAYGEVGGHDYGEWNYEVPSTSNQPGYVGHYECSVCQKYFDKAYNELDDIVIAPSHNFNGYKQPVAASCTTSGFKGHYYCSDCGKYFDFDGKEVTYESLIIPANNHETYLGACACGQVYADVTDYLEFIEVPADGTYQLIRYYGDTEDAPVHIKIPSTYNGKNVTRIRENVFSTIGEKSTYHNGGIPTSGYSGNKAIESVIIPDTITHIGGSAFANTALTEVVIPDSVHNGNKAEGSVFNGCKQLRKVTIGYKLEKIGGYFFSSCENLEEVIFREHEEKKFSLNPFGYQYTYYGVKEIGERAFYSCTSLKTLVLPSTLVSIPEGEIYVSGSNMHVTLGSMVSGCDVFINITEQQYNDLIIPLYERTEHGLIIKDGKLCSLGYSACSSCAAGINNGTITVISKTTQGYMYKCFGDSNVYFKGEWGYDSNGNPYAYGQEVEPEIEYDFTSGIYNVKNNGEIHSLTAEGMAQESIVVPSVLNGVTITSIGAYAFSGSAVKSVELPASITAINDSAFYNCVALESLKITSNVTYVGSSALLGCTSLRNLTVTSLVSGVNNLVLVSNNIDNVAKRLGEFTFAIVNGRYTITNRTNTYYLAEDGNAYTDTPVKTLVMYMGISTNVTIASDVVKIGESAFENSIVTSVTIPNTVTEIGKNAFKNSSLKSIIVPGSVKVIGEGAFAGCKYLKDITLGEGIEIIGTSAFYNDNRISTITIPSTVKKINDYAFANCDITSFKFNMTISEFNRVIFGNHWDLGNNFKYECLDGEGYYLKIDTQVEVTLGQSNNIQSNYLGLAEWSSMDESIATVDKHGVVTGQKIGVTYVKVKVGDKEALCKVVVSLNDCLPTLEFDNPLEDETIIEYSLDVMLFPYVSYGNFRVDGAEFEYEVGDSSVLQLVYTQDGVLVKGVGIGTSQLTVRAQWQGYTVEDCYLLEKTFEISVQTINVVFNLNGEYVRGITLSPSEEMYPSEVEFNPTVIINGSETYAVTEYSVTPYGTSLASCITIADGKIIANHKGKVKVRISYTYNGYVYTDAFDVQVVGDVIVDDEVYYEASTSTLRSTAFNDKEILKVTVYATNKNGAPVIRTLTPDNGITLTNDGYKFNARKSNDDANEGVPFVDSHLDGLTNEMRFVVETNATIYYFNNVKYYTEVIDNVAEMTKFVTFEYLNNITPKYVDYGYYILGTDIEFTGNENFSYHFGSFSYNNQFGFAGVFDGNGHSIKNFKPGEYGMFGGLRSISNVKTIVKNLAIVNIKSSGPVFAVRALYSNYVYAVNIENVYISYADGVTPAGLITNAGYTKAMKLTNVVIDSSKANGNIKLAKDNKAYGISEDYVIERASSSKGRILYALHTNYTGEMSHSAKQTEEAFENVISIGLTSLLGYSNAVNADMFTHTLTDGVYTHTAKTANLVGAWAAGNLATAEIPVPVSLKAGFASLVTNNDGSAISGYICNNCYKGFSLTTGICSSCSTVLTASSDLWSEIGSYNWGLYDLSTHVTGLVGDTNFKFAGISKYADVSKMPTNESYYSAFLGAQGNGMWAFKNNKLSFKGL